MYVEINKPAGNRQTSVSEMRQRNKLSDVSSSRIDTQSLAVKIYREEKRRASITPYKKAYALDNTSDDSDN